MNASTTSAPRLRGLRRIVIALALLLTVPALALTTSACKGGSEEKEEKKSAIEVFDGDKPTWPAELEGVEFGQTLEEWEAAGVVDKGKDKVKSKKFKGLTYYVETDHQTKRVDQLTLRFKSDDSIKEALTKRWGEPQSLADIMGSNDFVWVNEEAGLRARVSGDEEGQKSVWVYIDRYQPLSTVFTGEAGPLAFEQAAPILGKTAEELIAAYPDDYLVGEGSKPDQGHFELPPSEFDRSALRVHPYFDDDGKVGSYHLNLRVPDEKKADVLKLIETKFGAPPRTGKVFKDEVKVFYVNAHKMRVRVDDAGKNTVNVTVERFLPIEELFTADKSKLAFEGDKSWIGTLTKAQWDERQSGKNSWLQLPPTDFEAGNTMITPHFEGDLLKSYSFSVDGSLIPGTRDEILTRFKKALGEPTEGKTQFTDKPMYSFQTTPPVVLEESYSGDGWMVRVGQ